MLKLKKRIETALHFNMSLVGGFMGGFAVWNFCDLLGNAQTANMITLVSDIVGCNFFTVLLRIIGVLIYFLGFAMSVIVPRYTKLNLKLLSLFFDAAAMITLVLLPNNLELIIYLYPIFFAMSFQWTAFSGAQGFVSSTIFSTNNLRQFSTSLVEAICFKNKEKLTKTKFYGLTLVSYHIGVAIACVGSMFISIKSSFIGIILLIPATVFVMLQNDIINVNLKPFKVNFLPNRIMKQN